MSSLRTEVERFLVPRGYAGQPGAPVFDRKALRRALDRHRRSREVLFWIAVACTLLVFALAVGYAVVRREDPSRVNGMYAAGGVLLGGAAAIAKLWRARQTVDMVLALMSATDDDEALREALRKLIDKL